MDAAFLGLVVEGEVGVVLEDAEFAEFFGADAAGGDIGDAASFEADACVGDVFASGEDGDADGVDAFDGFALGGDLFGEAGVFGFAGVVAGAPGVDFVVEALDGAFEFVEA